MVDKDPELHAQLVQACIDELLECLQDESTLKLWRAKCAFAFTLVASFLT